MLDRRAIEGLIPHRDPFLLVDRVDHVDREAATIVCTYDLDRATPVLEGHFPRRPMWPGVLQVEAIGQAGICLVNLLSGAGDRGEEPSFILTQILGAEFVRPVTPGGSVEIVARAVFDGLFTILVGQCLQHDVVCCGAAVRGINDGDQHDS